MILPQTGSEKVPLLKNIEGLTVVIKNKNPIPYFFFVTNIFSYASLCCSFTIYKRENIPIGLYATQQE